MSDDARRARRILAFRDELDALTREGVAPLDPEARAAIDAHHEAILARLRAADVDTTTSAAQLSLAMRIATVVGTLALALAWGSFLGDLWDNIPMVPRLLLTGVHRYVRHPLYLGTFLALWGGFLLHPSAALLISNAITTTYTLIGIRLEEAKLLREFGAPYRHYQQQVPMLLPGAWRRKQ